MAITTSSSIRVNARRSLIARATCDARVDAVIADLRGVAKKILQNRISSPEDERGFPGVCRSHPCTKRVSPFTAGTVAGQFGVCLRNKEPSSTETSAAERWSHRVRGLYQF